MFKNKIKRDRKNIEARLLVAPELNSDREPIWLVLAIIFLALIAALLI